MPDPIYVRTFEQFTSFAVNVDDLDPIPLFLDVDAIIDPSTSNEGLLESVRQLATDLVSQGGVASIGSDFIKGGLGE